MKAAEDHAYQARILGMDKLELLEEMVRFQEERSRVGKLSLEMMVRGRYLFKALEENAETEELRLLARSFRRHLDYELAVLRGQYRQAVTQDPSEVSTEHSETDHDSQTGN